MRLTDLIARGQHNVDSNIIILAYSLFVTSRLNVNNNKKLNTNKYKNNYNKLLMNEVGYCQV